MDIKQHVPNFLSTVSFLCGMSSILWARDNFTYAGVLILVAFFFDGIDGRIARYLNVSTSFGVVFDSLCDVVSFVVAPAVLAYVVFFAGIAPNWCVVPVFLYGVCGLYRLARFSSASAEKGQYFQGMPTPNAAGLLAGLVIHRQWFSMSKFAVLLSWPMVVIFLIACSILMVSRVPFFAMRISNTSLWLQIMLFVFIGLCCVVSPYCYMSVSLFTLLFPLRRLFLA